MEDVWTGEKRERYQVEQVEQDVYDYVTFCRFRPDKTSEYDH